MGIYLEYLGYVASLIVLVSLLMSSLKKLRWINLVGATLFGIYGFMIGSIPTGLMNLGIVIIDIYYLVKMYKNKDFFQVLQITSNSEYLTEFIRFYKQDIESFMILDDLDVKNAAFKFYVLRNMNPAGVFIADKYDETTLEIRLDYVVPMYRDFKIGLFVFNSQRETFLQKGFTSFTVTTDNPNHIKYLHRMGFELSETDGENVYRKQI